MEAAMPAALELLPEPAGFRFALEEEELLEAAAELLPAVRVLCTFSLLSVVSSFFFSLIFFATPFLSNL